MKRLQASYVHACLPVQGVCAIVLAYSAELEGVCVQTLRGPDAAVTCLAALPDGDLASGSHDGTVRVWDVGTASSINVDVFDLSKSGLHVRTLAGHEGRVMALATLTDGTLASASYDDTVRMWDAASGRCVHTLRGHKSFVLVLAALPDNKVASGSADCTVRVWDNDGNCLRTFDIDNGWVCALAAWPDGRIASSGAHGGEIQLPQTKDGERKSKSKMTRRKTYLRQTEGYPPHDAGLHGAAQLQQQVLPRVPGAHQCTQTILAIPAV
jgi:WD40 repeat protein